ncbi:MAG: argininosuccinate synthase [Acidobacteria bacterium]|nr:argininosuccinate synthase [Acidobacteriota bacterium]
MHVVLAYSGGLDTSTAIPWLKEVKQAEKVTAVLVNVGQNEDLEAASSRAYALGADSVHIVDKIQAMVQDGIAPMLKAGAVYEGSYLLGTAIARPFIADALVEIALQVGAQAICHGATGKGNDYLRFEQRIRHQAPGLAIIAPWREWDLKDRDSALAMLSKTGVDLPTKSFAYSVDANLWHTSYEGGPLEDLTHPVPDEIGSRMLSPGIAHIHIGFKDGLPCSLNGQSMALSEIIQQLNQELATTGYGWEDLVETRTNGLKSRGIYYTPAGTLLYAARTALAQVWFPKPTLDYLDQQSNIYGKMVYEGAWDHPMRAAMDAAIDQIFAGTEGEIHMVIKGAQMLIQKRTCNPSLFDTAMSGFGHMDVWDDSFSDALVFLQRMKYHSKPYPVLLGVLT